MSIPVGNVLLNVRALTPAASAELSIVWVIVLVELGPSVLGENATVKVGGAANTEVLPRLENKKTISNMKYLYNNLMIKL